MKAGVNIDSEKVFIEVATGNGMNTTVEMNPNAARMLSEQLMASAKALEFAIEQGLADNDDSNG